MAQKSDCKRQIEQVQSARSALGLSHYAVLILHLLFCAWLPNTSRTLRLCVSSLSQALCLAVVVFGWGNCLTQTARAADNQPPNFLIILADDLGFSDIGCYGGEIATPNLDALAAAGLRYTQFYNTARCWPTRAALLTGYYAQQVGFDALPDVPRSDRRKRPPWARLLPEYLRPFGYRSYHAGKWHLDSAPVAAGFDRSYWLEDYNRYFSPHDHKLDDQPLPPIEKGSGYYATTAIADYAIEFLQQHAQQHSDKPFFHYVAFLAPHFPLHAPAEDIARYLSRYQAGWDDIRRERWQRIQQMLRLPAELSSLEPNIGPPYHNPLAHEVFGVREVYQELSWSQLTSEQQDLQAAKMAIHAAMVDRLDRDIGRIVEQLRRMDALEDTVILFCSDNGASAEIMVRGDGHNNEAPPGSAQTFLCLGPGWSSAANTPFRRHKSWVHEGGIATPLIVHWPDRIKDAGAVRQNAVGHVIDFAPSLLELAGGRWPTSYEGQELPPSPGRNLAPTFDGDTMLQRDMLWWFHQGHRAIRRGDWKLVAARNEPWKLYDVSSDRAENHDLSAEHPDKARELEQLWNETSQEFRKLTAAHGTK
jgi:arylsulfatase A-like enzyme